tara:strand:+ start:1966 stop:3591 length:1626 start_codon:yes stop_codon:yes gene_type:complete
MGRSITGNTSAVSVSGTVNTITAQGGRQPLTPVITSPTSNQQIANFTPSITTSAFFSYGSDTHSGSNWQIASDEQFSDSSTIVDFASNSSLVSYTVGSSDLPRTAGTYYVRARHVSSGFEASAFSAARAFQIDATLGASIALNGSSVFQLTATYTGTGSFSTFDYILSANSDMSNPVETGTFSSSNHNISYTTAPGLFTGTTYYVQLTSGGANAVPKTTIISLAGDATSGVTGSASAELSGSTVIVTSNINVPTGPTILHQFSTTSTFDSVFYETTSTSFADSNLPGLANRSQSYFYRPAAQLGNEKVALQTASSIGASFLYTTTQSFNTQSGYTGSILVEAIGGGGSGAGAYQSGSGGSSGNFESSTISVSQQESVSVSIGAGGPGSGWSNPSSPDAGSTTVTIGSLLSLTAAGGKNADMNYQYRRTGADVNKSAYGGEPGSSYGGGSQPGIDGQNHPITGLGGGSGGTHNGGGGQGGAGYGAGGGGQSRSGSYGGNGGGGGGGGGAFDATVSASAGTGGNVGSGGGGRDGAVKLTYQNW